MSKVKLRSSMEVEHRPDPDKLLERVEAVEPPVDSPRKGKIRVYIGAAPGVGKTFAALHELHRRRDRGTDAVVGYVETYNRPKTMEALEGLEIVPRRTVNYRGVTLSEMDTDAIIRRHPEVVLVDELAHTNVPGSKHEKRYQDVQEILDAGIDVIATLNIQHLESLNDVVEQITGVKVRETIPDAVLDCADDIQLIDSSPHELRRRMIHGNVYREPQKIQQALENFFREGNLAALRELALRRTASEVDEQIQRYRQQHEIVGPWPTAQRFLVAIDERALSARLLRRAWRLASPAKAEIIALYVEPSGGPESLPAEQREALAEHLQLARDLGMDVVTRRGDEVAREIVDFARSHNINHLVLGESTHSFVHRLLRGSIVDRILRETQDVDIHIIADRS